MENPQETGFPTEPTASATTIESELGNINRKVFFNTIHPNKLWKILGTPYPQILTRRPKKKYSILRLHPLIMLADNRLIHFLNRCKRPIAITNDISMREVII